MSSVDPTQILVATLYHFVWVWISVFPHPRLPPQCKRSGYTHQGDPGYTTNAPITWANISQDRLPSNGRLWTFLESPGRQWVITRRYLQFMYNKVH